MDPSSGFLINSISSSARPDPAVLTGASYSGIINASNLKLNFTTSGILRFNSSLYTQYTVSGGGIRFNEPGDPFDSRYYLLVQNNNTVLKGIHCVLDINPKYYGSLTLTKD